MDTCKVVKYCLSWVFGVRLSMWFDLETWSHQGSITQSKETYAVVKRALEALGTAYARKDFKVFLQGSYGNDTNNHQYFLVRDLLTTCWSCADCDLFLHFLVKLWNEYTLIRLL